MDAGTVVLVILAVIGALALLGCGFVFLRRVVGRARAKGSSVDGRCDAPHASGSDVGGGEGELAEGGLAVTRVKVEGSPKMVVMANPFSQALSAADAEQKRAPTLTAKMTPLSLGESHAPALVDESRTNPASISLAASPVHKGTGLRKGNGEASVPRESKLGCTPVISATASVGDDDGGETKFGTTRRVHHAANKGYGGTPGVRGQRESGSQIIAHGAEGPSRLEKIKEGSRVVVVNTSRADLNGQEGTVAHSEHNATPDKERWQVTLDSNGQTIALKPFNLKPLCATWDSLAATAKEESVSFNDDDFLEEDELLKRRTEESMSFNDDDFLEEDELRKTRVDKSISFNDDDFIGTDDDDDDSSTVLPDSTASRMVGNTARCADAVPVETNTVKLNIQSMPHRSADVGRIDTRLDLDDTQDARLNIANLPGREQKIAPVEHIATRPPAAVVNVAPPRTVPVLPKLRIGPFAANAAAARGAPTILRNTANASTTSTTATNPASPWADRAGDLTCDVDVAGALATLRCNTDSDDDDDDDDDDEVNDKVGDAFGSAGVFQFGASNAKGCSGTTSDEGRGIALLQSPHPPLGLSLKLPTAGMGFDPSETERKSTKLAQFANECSEVLPFLFVGGAVVSANRNTLRQSGITHVLNCAGDIFPNAFDHGGDDGLEYTRLFLHDSKQEMVGCFFLRVVGLVESVRRKQGRLFIHCHQGVSRASSMAIAYLIWSRMYDYQSALDYMRSCRGVARPNVGFMCQLIQFARMRQESQTSLLQRLPELSKSESNNIAAVHAYEMMPHPALWRRHEDARRASVSGRLTLDMHVSELENHIVPVLCTRGGDWTDGQPAQPSVSLLHSRGCFLITAVVGKQSQQLGSGCSTTVFVWVGGGVGSGDASAGSPAQSRDTVIRAAQRFADMYSRICFSFDGESGDTAGEVVLVEEGAEPPLLLNALGNTVMPGGGDASAANQPVDLMTLTVGDQTYSLEQFYSGDLLRELLSRSPSSEEKQHTATPRQDEEEKGGGLGQGPDAKSNESSLVQEDESDSALESSPSKAPQPELYQYDGPGTAWEYIGQYEEDDLLSTDVFVLLICEEGAALEITAFTWRGSDSDADIPTFDASVIESAVVAGDIPSSSYASLLQAGATLNVHHEVGGDESDEWWECFESGY